jgi:acyl phosphate:glycerol-3-phosphate acyltransferase
MLTAVLVAALVGYFLGALPFGFLVARAHGVNIFEVGSRNPGATNVRRVLGAKAGNMVFALDALKGALAAAAPMGLARLGWLPIDAGANAATTVLTAAVVAVVAALIGHSFSCFTRFRGGKGVATASGGFLVLMPLATVVTILVWIITFYAARYVSLASILAAIALPLAAWGFGRPGLIIGIATVVGLFVILRHRANIVRLLSGTEARFERKPKSTANS